MQNGFVDSIKGRLRDAFMNKTLFTTLAQASFTLPIWRADHNGARPHAKPNWHTPSAFAAIVHPHQ